MHGFCSGGGRAASIKRLQRLQRSPSVGECGAENIHRTHAWHCADFPPSTLGWVLPSRSFSLQIHLDLVGSNSKTMMSRCRILSRSRIAPLLSFVPRPAPKTRWRSDCSVLDEVIWCCNPKQPRAPHGGVQPCVSAAVGTPQMLSYGLHSSNVEILTCIPRFFACSQGTAQSRR